MALNNRINVAYFAGRGGGEIAKATAVVGDRSRHWHFKALVKWQLRRKTSLL